MASYADWAARLRVSLHFLLAAVMLWLAQPTSPRLEMGAGLIALGLVVRGWAAGHLRRDQPLTASGPYAHLRHPLYLGSALIFSGFAVAADSWWLAALVVAYFALVFVPVMRREERERRARAPELYPAYAAQVPALLPRLRPARIAAESPARFDFRLYLRNREWQALAGCAVLVALLWAKIHLS